MTTDLKSLCLRFEKHCDECKGECRQVYASVEFDVKGRPNLIFIVESPMALCAEGKSILLEIFQ